MKEIDKKRTPNNIQSKRSVKAERHQNFNVKEIESKALQSKPVSNVSAGDLSNSGLEQSVAYENMVIHFVDDVNGNPNGGIENSDDLDKEVKQGKEEDSDSETFKDSLSSQGHSVTAEDDKVEKVSNAVKAGENKKLQDGQSRGGSRLRSDTAASRSRSKVNDTPKKPSKPSKGPAIVRNKSSSDKMVKDTKAPRRVSSDSSEGVDDNKPAEDRKEMDGFDETSNGTQSVASDNEMVDAEENGECKVVEALNRKVESMEIRMQKLEEELREVAALEISLYSVVPEHGSSAHKVHTPARRLSRLYIHGCKHWSPDKRATIAKNTVSGLVLIAKSCGSDVPRLTFWLSNAIVLREIIFQAFGSSRQSSTMMRSGESNGINKRSDGSSALLKWKGSSGSTHMNGFMLFIEDWLETGTFTSALEKVESWIFSRLVESVWWQALTPHMQSTCGDRSIKSAGRLLGPALGDQQQGSFSINLWKNAFRDAFQRLCPLRAAGHECGCLPVIARMVMEQCVARLDVAMFNAILRESAHEIPTDPVSDPIVDSKVLPIPAGDLSFGSGAQLKNSVGNWSRLLTDLFGMDADDTAKEDQSDEEDDWQGGKPKSFRLLNDLSDLLMLPKDMLLEQPIRKEVCPSISLSLVKRILCNFTPDEFCPDAVPGAVLEALNAESEGEQRLSGDTAQSFPYTAAPVVYTAPSSAEVAEKVAEAGERSQLSRSVSAVQRKGYTSDDELEELNSPLTFLIGSSLPSSSLTVQENGTKKEVAGSAITNARYELLREVWSDEC